MVHVIQPTGGTGMGGRRGRGICQWTSNHAKCMYHRQHPPSRWMGMCHASNKQH